MSDETLISFDARTPSAEWNDARRSLYLLRHVQTPLSVDRNVWPGLSDEWNGAIQGHWDDLAKLRRSLVNQTFTTVAVTIVTRGRAPTRAAVTPATRDENWKLLGYDIADEWLTSGLSNCGYRENEVAALRASWAEDRLRVSRSS